MSAVKKWKWHDAASLEVVFNIGISREILVILSLNLAWVKFAPEHQNSKSTMEKNYSKRAKYFSQKFHFVQDETVDVGISSGPPKKSH